MRRMADTRKALNPTIMGQFFFRVFPITPTCKISAWLNMDMAPNIRGQLMNQLDNFYGLQYGKRRNSIATSHSQLCGTTKTRTDSNRTRTILRFLESVFA